MMPNQEYVLNILKAFSKAEDMFQAHRELLRLEEEKLDAEAEILRHHIELESLRLRNREVQQSSNELPHLPQQAIIPNTQQMTLDVQNNQRSVQNVTVDVHERPSATNSNISMLNAELNRHQTEI